jgi:hypothetical protein
VQKEEYKDFKPLDVLQRYKRKDIKINRARQTKAPNVTTEQFIPLLRRNTKNNLILKAIVDFTAELINRMAKTLRDRENGIWSKLELTQLIGTDKTKSGASWS